MAGYATGEVFFTSQALGFRHSHLDAGGYSFDQKHPEKDVQKAIEFLIADEGSRCFLTSMVSCLFARGVYTEPRLAECLKTAGYSNLADTIAAAGRRIQSERWRLRIATGYNPDEVFIPRRFLDVATWKGPVDPAYLDALRLAYGRSIREMGKPALAPSQPDGFSQPPESA
jgi:aldehyde:ferredoxin oxidoreductase